MRTALLTLAAALLIAGCGGDSDEDRTVTETVTTPTATEQPTDQSSVPTTLGEPTATTQEGPEGTEVLACGEAREGFLTQIVGIRIPCPAAVAVAEAWLDEVQGGEAPTSEIGVLETSCTAEGQEQVRVTCVSTADARTQVRFTASP